MTAPKFVVVCDDASGGTPIGARAMPIEEFAKLFTYGRTVQYEGGECVGETYDIRVAAPVSSDSQKGTK